MLTLVQQGLRDDGIDVSVSRLCRWFGVPRRSVYYRATKSAAKLQEQLVNPVKAMIEDNPSFDYRTVAHLLGMNKNTDQPIFQIKGWQVSKTAVGFRPRIQSLPSVAKAPDERWATDLCRVWAGKDGWTSLALVIDCYSPEQNGMVERVIRTLKDQCVHRHRFESLQHASRQIADWIGFYNNQRPHQALGMKTPAEAYALAAWPVLKRLGQVSARENALLRKTPLFGPTKARHFPRRPVCFASPRH